MLTHSIIFFYHDAWTFKQEAEIKKYEDSLTFSIIQIMCYSIIIWDKNKGRCKNSRTSE